MIQTKALQIKSIFKKYLKIEKIIWEHLKSLDFCFRKDKMTIFENCFHNDMH